MGAAKGSSGSGSTKNRSGESFVAAQMRRQKRQALWWRIGITAVVVLLAVGVGVGILVSRSDNNNSTEAVTAPSAFTSDGALVFGSDTAPTVSITEDFQCPACKQFNEILGPTVADLISSGQARVEYHPVAILNRMSTDDYSSRAGSAAVCVAEQSPDLWQPFADALFTQQPAEGGAGLTNDQLVQIAAAADADSSDTAACITDERYVPWISQMTDQATQAGLRGTPTVTVAGEQLQDMTPDGLRTAVENAAS